MNRRVRIRRRIAILGLMLSALGLAMAAQTPQENTTALVGARLIDGTGAPPIEKATVIFHGGRISAVGQEGLVPIPSNAVVIHLEGKNILPGLIEGNGHVIYSGQSKYATFLVRHLDDYYQLGARNLYTCLMQGITTVRDTMDALKEMLQLREDVQSGKIAGSRLFTSGIILNVPGSFRQDTTEILQLQPALVQRARAIWTLDIESEAQGRQVVRDYAKQGVDFIKLSAYTGYGARSDQGGPKVLTPTEIKAIVDEAHKLGLPVTTHTLSVDSVRTVVQSGVDAMEHPEMMDEHLKDEVLPDDLIAQIVHQQIYCVPLISYAEMWAKFYKHPELLSDPYYIANAPADLVAEARQRVKFDLDENPEIVRTPENVYQLARTNLRKLIQGGALIAMGTDRGSQLNFHDFNSDVRELELFVELGMTPMQAIIAATKNGAGLLRKERDLGTIQPGKLADVIVVDGNPLERIGDLRFVTMVFKSGVRYK
jgi:imidazolonepropionase-like amidohydrolase